MLYVIRREGQLLAWQSLLLSPHCRNVAAMFNCSVCAAAKHIVGGFTKRASVVRWQAWQCDPLTNQSSTNLPSHNFPCKAMIACTSITQDFKFVDLYPASTWQKYQQHSTRNFKISISHASVVPDVCDVTHCREFSLLPEFHIWGDLLLIIQHHPNPKQRSS